MKHTPKFPSQAGIAIGPILFILAILALIAAVMSSGNGDYQVASGADRITADIVAQANLIRGMLNQCNMQYTIAVSTGSVTPTTDPYPASDTSNGTTASALVCTPMGTTSLWSDKLLPPPTQGFSAWTYIDASASGGGRCIWATPSTSNPVHSESVTSGLTHAATKFNSATAFDTAHEVIYDPASASQKFTVWITLPTGTPDSHCLP
jgi:hypothetical protein